MPPLAPSVCRRVGLGPWLIAAACLLTHLPFAPELPTNRDGHQFADGVLDYDVAAGRPHWPGYPLYIAMGKLAFVFVDDPYVALSAVSALATALLVLPLAALGRRAALERGADEAEASTVGLAAGLVWTALPASWLDGMAIWSDPAGLLLAMLALERLSYGAGGAAGLLAGLVPGVRLSYLPLLLPLLRRPSRRALGGVLVALALWWGAELVQGGLGWFTAARSTLEGFLGVWGGSTLTDAHAAERPLRALRTFLCFGLGAYWPGGPLARLPATALLLVTVAVGSVRLRRSPTAGALGLSALAYAVWVLVVHSVDLARYYLPLAAMTAVVVANGLPRGRGGLLALAAALAALLPVSVPLARRHAALVPLELQAARILEDLASREAVVVLLPAASTSLAHYAPALRSEVLLQQAPARVEALVGEGYTVVASRDTLLLREVPLRGFHPLAELSVDPLVVSRGAWHLHLLVRRPDPR